MRLTRPLLLLLAAIVIVVPGAQAEPVVVDVGILLINFGNYDSTKGTYQMDFYLWMRWNDTGAPDDFSPKNFEFMNGRAANKDILSESDDNGSHEIFYRINANLYSEPQFKQYPYDQQKLRIILEDAIHTRDQLIYRPLLNESGLDETVRVAGWRIQQTDYHVDAKDYRFDESYSRLAFDVVVKREPLSTSLKTLLPPLAFMFVSGLSFFFDPSKSAQRVGLGTSMLISAVMYHISQTVNLPPLGSLILLDKIMISVYAFLAGSLAVTTMIVLNEDHWKKPERNESINRKGAWLTLALPIVTFLFLLAF